MNLALWGLILLFAIAIHKSGFPTIRWCQQQSYGAFSQSKPLRTGNAKHKREHGTPRGEDNSWRRENMKYCRPSISSHNMETLNYFILRLRRLWRGAFSAAGTFTHIHHHNYPSANVFQVHLDGLDLRGLQDLKETQVQLYQRFYVHHMCSRTRITYRYVWYRCTRWDGAGRTSWWTGYRWRARRDGTTGWARTTGRKRWESCLRSVAYLRLQQESSALYDRSTYPSIIMKWLTQELIGSKTITGVCTAAWPVSYQFSLLVHCSLPWERQCTFFVGCKGVTFQPYRLHDHREG